MRVSLRGHTMLEKLVIGAGAMKAGTTWLYKQLEVHPQVHFTPEKELHYFSHNKGLGLKLAHSDRQKKLQLAVKKKQSVKTIDWYKNYAEPEIINDRWYCSLFQSIPRNVYCADFSNQYSLLEEEDLEKILKIAKHVKVIYTLRDPLARLWSHIKFHYKFKGEEDLVDELTLKEFRKLINKAWFWKNVEYASNYDRLVSVFGQENVKVFYLEDFIAFPQGSLWHLEKFLSIRHIDYQSDASDTKINASKELSMPTQWEKMAMRKLKPYYEEFYARNLNHPSWRY